MNRLRPTPTKSKTDFDLRSGQTKQLDNQLRVSTPENISFQYILAGPFRRFAAYLLDILISLGGYAIIVIAMWMFIGLVLAPLAAGTGMQVFVDAIVGMASALMLAGLFFVFWFYGAYMETYYNGRTFGKMITGLRVTSHDGSAINAGKATLRNFFRLLDAMPSITPAYAFGWFDVGFPIPLFAVGLIAMMVSRKYQRVGDLVAGTIVIVEEREFTYSLAQFEDARVPKLAELIPKDFNVPASLATALAEYVDRRRFLPYQRVAEVAAHLGEPLIQELKLAQDTNHDLLLCSLYYKTYIDQQQEEIDNPVQILSPPNTAQPAAPTGRFSDLQKQPNATFAPAIRPTAEPTPNADSTPTADSTPNAPKPEINFGELTDRGQDE